MFEVVKKALFTGIGLATLTREKIQDLGREVAEKARLTEAQSQEFQDELQRRADQARGDLQAMIDRRVDQAYDRAGLVSRDQFTALVARVEALEKELQALRLHGPEGED